MKRGDLVRHLRRTGCTLARKGANHSLYLNPANNELAAVPRHAEIPNKLVREICKQLDIEAPAG